MTRILFYRDLQYFSGGHLKVFHYFQHALESGRYAPRIAFSETSLWDERNPWRDYRELCADWDASCAEIVFLAGMDWSHALEHGLREFDGPVINLVQHVRHADPEQPLHAFLSEPAVRICVSGEVADAILATGRVNGPVYTLANGIESGPTAETTPGHDEPRDPVLVLGTKRTEFARELASALRRRGLTTTLHDNFVPRAEFLDLLARHPIVVCCPDLAEGFYLPALEAMGRRAFVICPDCVGNRGFCIDGQTCLVPAYTMDDLLKATQRAGRIPSGEFARLRARGARMAQLHSLERERASFLRLLDRIVETRTGD